MIWRRRRYRRRPSRDVAELLRCISASVAAMLAPGRPSNCSAWSSSTLTTPGFRAASVPGVPRIRFGARGWSKSIGSTHPSRRRDSTPSSGCASGEPARSARRLSRSGCGRHHIADWMAGLRRLLVPGLHRCQPTEFIDGVPVFHERTGGVELGQGDALRRAALLVHSPRPRLGPFPRAWPESQNLIFDHVPASGVTGHPAGCNVT